MIFVPFVVDFGCAALECFPVADNRAWPNLGRMLHVEDLFDLTHTKHAALFEGCARAWEVLTRLEAYLAANARSSLANRCDGVAFIGDKVTIGPGSVVEDGAMIKGPAIIGSNCTVRHNAYIRENVVIGDGCLVGNSCEIKNSILFDNVQVPHFNYVGDSVLGYRSHLGAGVKVSNFKLDGTHVFVEWDGQRIDTGLRKFGVLLGDQAEVGCNAVLNPGSIVGKRSMIYPNVNWRGILPADSIAKNRAQVDVTPRTAR